MSVTIVQKGDFDLRDVLSRATFTDNVANPEMRLKEWLLLSDQIWLGMYDEQVACVWGLIAPSIVSDRAFLWLLTTDLVEAHKFIFIRHSQLVIENALKDYETIVGTVAVGNHAARKWLRWLGAKIYPPEKGFSPFEIRRK